jgi:glycine/D-amino acid oxidase-like deaminating enzyme
VSVDVVVVGAGIVGAACAYYAACDGLSVCVIDRGALAGGTTSVLVRGTCSYLTRNPAPS